ncbi:MAG: hypothetical protein EXS08_07390 [Planctomycetes bacterium]|nr:hypothetical protein [Planctomycetota bacterium]
MSSRRRAGADRISIKNLVFGLLALSLLCTAVNLACVYGREPSVRAVTLADTRAAPPSPAEAGEPLVASRVALVPEAPRVADDSTREPAEESVDPFSPALRAYALAELQRGWSEVRNDPLPAQTLDARLRDYEELVRTTPASWGRRAAEERNEDLARLAALDANDGIAWLEKLDERDPLASELPRSAERFAALFRPKSGGRAHDGPSLRAEDPLADGAVLVFPAGVFALADFARDRDPFPADVTLRGAGMNATLLVLDELNPRGALLRFTLEDCTVFADHGIVDVRNGPSLLALRRVRLVGFDCGAGGSCALRVRKAALSAVDCRFEGGYGRNPSGYANLVRGGHPLLARFERCTLERVALDDAGQPTVSFVDCLMTDMLAEPPEGPLFQGCSIGVLDAERLRDPLVRQRDLNELFPGWRERVQRR